MGDYHRIDGVYCSHLLNLVNAMLNSWRQDYSERIRLLKTMITQRVYTVMTKTVMKLNSQKYQLPFINLMDFYFWKVNRFFFHLDNRK